MCTERLSCGFKPLPNPPLDRGGRSRRASVGVLLPFQGAKEGIRKALPCAYGADRVCKPDPLAGRGCIVFRHARQRGLTIIELIVFIVVVSIGLAGVLSVLNYSNKVSVNPMLLKQQVAIAESLLEEIGSKAFTWCDPDDAKVSTATSAAGCSTAQGIGATAGETRFPGATSTPFDNVGDYHAYAMASGILNPYSGAAISGLGKYSVSVAITQAGSALGLADNTAALRIDVSVTAPDGGIITLTAYRTRYAPNTP
jgi:MSHA pilin protein MshD